MLESPKHRNRSDCSLGFVRFHTVGRRYFNGKQRVDDWDEGFNRFAWIIRVASALVIEFDKFSGPIKVRMATPYFTFMSIDAGQVKRMKILKHSMVFQHPMITFGNMRT